MSKKPHRDFKAALAFEEGLDELSTVEETKASADVPSARAAFKFTEGQAGGPSLIAIRLQEEVVRKRLEGGGLMVRTAEPPVPRTPVSAVATMLAQLVEMTVSTYYSDDDPEREGHALSPLMLINAPASRDKLWSIHMLPYPASAYVEDGEPLAEAYSPDIQAHLARLLKHLIKASGKKVILHGPQGGGIVIKAGNPAVLVTLFETMFLQQNYPSLDSVIGHKPLPRDARSEKRKSAEEPKKAEKTEAKKEEKTEGPQEPEVAKDADKAEEPKASEEEEKGGKRYFKSAAEYKAYTRVYLDPQLDELKSRLKGKPPEFSRKLMGTLMPQTFASQWHAALNSICANNVPLLPISFSQIRNEIEAVMERRKPAPCDNPLMNVH